MNQLKIYDRKPLIFLSIIFLLTIFAGLKEPEILGFRICGWSWVLSLFVACLFLFFIKGNRISFPIILWIPFFLYLAIMSDINQRDDIYRLLIFLCPVFVGISASRLYLYNYKKLRIYNIRSLGGLLIVYIIAVLISGNRFPTDIYAIAGPPMTAALLLIIALEDHLLERWKLYLISLVCFIYCIVVEARMPIIIIPTLFILRLKFASFSRRLFILVGLFLIAYYLFYTDAVQANLFRGGSGTILDLLSFDTSLLKTGGRLYAWPIYWNEILNSPFFGHGSTFSVDFGTYSFGGWSHPHNEYIRILFDYGFVGAFLFIVPILYLCYLCFIGVRNSLSEGTKWLCSIGLWGLISMFLLGITGNVLMYVAWYGNLLFAIIGFALARLDYEKLQSS